MNICDINDIKALLARHSFRFSKSMGQNFLIDQSVLDCTIEGSGIDETYGVIEVGPGIGTLTVELSKHAKLCGADAVSSVTPLYYKYSFAEVTNAELFAKYQKLISD